MTRHSSTTYRTIFVFFGKLILDAVYKYVHGMYEVHEECCTTAVLVLVWVLGYFMMLGIPVLLALVFGLISMGQNVSFSQHSIRGWLLLLLLMLLLLLLLLGSIRRHCRIFIF